MNDEILTAIHDAATTEGLDPKLLRAICTVESSLRPDAFRFEKSYQWLYQTQTQAKIQGISQDSEEAAQRFSYGLGQVMGAVCREYGYKGNLLRLVTDWKVSLSYAAKHLKRFVKARSKVEDAVASYNAGSVRKLADGSYANQVYVDKVMAELKKLG